MGCWRGVAYEDVQYFDCFDTDKMCEFGSIHSECINWCMKVGLVGCTGSTLEFVALEFAEVWILEMFNKVCNPRVRCTRTGVGNDATHVIDKRW